MERAEKILVCDVCHTEASDKGQPWFGGHPTHGWVRLFQRNGSTCLEELHKKREWDICSIDCLKKLIENNFVIFVENDEIQGFVKGTAFKKG